MKKKILFFHFNLGGGGAEKVLVNLLNQLDLSKYDITLFTLFGDGVNNQYLRPEIRHKWLFCKTFHGLTSLMKLFSPKLLHKLLIHENYDVEVAYLENSPTRIISGCTNKNTRKFAWVHTQINNVNDFFSPYRNLSEAKACYAAFDKIVFVSKDLETNFIKRTGWSLLPTQVIYNTVDISRVIELSQMNSDIVPKKGVLNICSVGRLIQVKGYGRLFPILKKIKNEGFHFHFYLLGTGEEYDTLLNYTRDNGLENEITFCGYRDNPYSIVSQMDLFICSSSREGFSTAVSEAVIMKIPVLTTNCSGMEEILHNGKYGMIVDNNEEALYMGLKNIMIDNNLLLQYKKNLQVGVSINYSVFDVEQLLDS